MTAATNGPGREPVAWIDPKYVVGRPYGTGQSPVTTYRINGWTPLYAAPPAAPPAPAADAREILHVLRNTHGYTESYIRAMRLAAAALIEQQARELADERKLSAELSAELFRSRRELRGELSSERDRHKRTQERAERAESARATLARNLTTLRDMLMEKNRLISALGSRATRAEAERAALAEKLRAESDLLDWLDRDDIELMPSVDLDGHPWMFIVRAKDGERIADGPNIRAAIIVARAKVAP